MRVAAIVLLALSSVARAQSTVEGASDTESGASAEAIADLPQPGFWEGGGVRVTEGTVFHPSFGVAGGYQSNVFYQDSGDGPGGPVGAGLARISAGASFGTIDRGRLEVEAPGGGGDGGRLVFHLDGLLTWNQFFSSDDTISGQSDLGIGLNADFKLNPRGKVTFAVRDSFVRSVNPGQSLREDSDRDRNELAANVTFRPGGGAIEGYLGYVFIVDIFESSILLFQDRMSHSAVAGARWQWLPRTQISLDASIATVNPSNQTLKSPSLPLRVTLGASSLITPAVGLVARAGYGNGFYERGANLSTWLAQLEARLYLGPTLRTAVGYSHDFADALVGNYYIDHQLYGRLGWQVLDRLQLRLLGEVRFRSYGGIEDTAELDLCGDASCGNFRSDVLAKLDALLEYQINMWLFGGVGYTLLADRTDFFVRSSTADDSGAYVASEVTLRLSARF
jgi:hypothetical protein